MNWLKYSVAGSWWAWLFSAFSLAAYLYLSGVRSEACSELSFRLEELRGAEEAALQEQEELLLRLQSEQDPSWRERVLMRELGLVPKGWVKVYFTR